MKKLLIALTIILALTLSGCGRANSHCIDKENITIVDWEIDQGEIILLKLEDGRIVKPVTETCLVEVE